MIIYGKNPILERINADPKSIKKLYLQQKTDLSEIVRAAKTQGLGFESVSKDDLARLCGEGNLQGVAAEITEYEYMPFDAMLKKARNQDIVPVFLDGITDPQNLGAIIRNLACLGGFSIVIPEHESASVNATVIRVACGGENYVMISKVVNIVKGITKVKEQGFFVAGAVAGDGRDMPGYELTFPLAAVIGAEGKGIRPGVMRHLDVGLSLPMKGARLSYNVAVAAALFCYEINRRRAEHGPKES